MSPEEMLAENLPVESPSPEPQGGPEEGQNPEGEPQEPTLREQVTEILADIPLELRHYKELFSALSAYVNELNHSMVTVTAVTSNIDWLNDVRESRNQCPGLIFSEKIGSAELRHRKRTVLPPEPLGQLFQGHRQHRQICPGRPIRSWVCPMGHMYRSLRWILRPCRREFCRGM
mgnify:CR=1 FL=1